MSHRIKISTLDELPAAAAQLLRICKNTKVFAFYGEMGVGKTTFIQHLCHQLKVIDDATSPTYPIVNEYHTIEQKIIYHLDLYRLNDLEEARQIGINEYLYNGDYCFIEWPQIIAPILDEHTVSVSIIVSDNGVRIITINPKHGKEINKF